MQYKVGTFREAGLEAKWSKTRGGAPMILTRNPISKRKHQSEQWWVVSKQMWERAQKVGITQAFDEHTIMGDLFYL